MRKRYAFAGASGRVIYGMYLNSLVNEFKDIAEIVGVYDINPKRSHVLRKKSGIEIPVYEDFNQMLCEAKPDVVIVSTVDRYHHEYIIKSLEAGCDVITEKPMTIDEDKCNAILEAEKRTGQKVHVTFNLRFSPFCVRVKEIVKSGAIGDIYSAHFEWMLDTSHGADYFRRWHRKKENSGGLLVHKATHHFDLINWFIEQEPEIVNAFGSRRFYGPTREARGIRCLTCQYIKECEFYFDIRSLDSTKELYLECEDVDGYYRDRCVFSEDINIEDTMSVNVRYSGGALMSYSLTSHSPYEGYRIALNGSEGRMEVEDFHGAIGAYAGEGISRIRIYNRKGEETSIKIPKVTGDHGGGDERLIRMIVRGDIKDPLGQTAGSRAGAMSAIIGIAANRSMSEGCSIRVKDLLDI